MPHNKIRILSIDPGTREMGIAVLDESRLSYHGVQSFRRSGSPHERLREARDVVLRLVEDFRPTVVAVEATFFARNRNVALLNVLVEEIYEITRRSRLTFVRLAPSTVKKAITGDGRASKAEVARVIAAEYPPLKAYLSSDRKWKEAYHANMFDAVAVGLTAFRRVLRDG